MVEHRDMIADAPVNPGPLQRGKEALSRGDRDRALSCFERAVGNNPHGPYARMALGNLLRDLGRFDEATAQYCAIVERHPHHVNALLCLSQIARQTKHPQAALEHLSAASTAEPGNITVRIQIAHTLRSMDRLDEAWSAYQAILEEFPATAGAVAGLGYVSQKRDDKVAAAAYFQRALALGAGDHGLLAGLADVLIDLGRNEEAAAIYARTGDPDGLTAARLLGRVARRLGQKERAVQHLRVAVGIDPGNPAPRMELAGLLRSLHRVDEAITVYEDILARDNQHIHALQQLGAIARMRRDPETALPHLQALAGLDPSDLQASFDLAEALVATGRLSQAEPIYRRLLAEAPQRPKAQAGLAAIARLRGDLILASEHLKAAASLDPAVIGYRFELAGTFRDLGDWPGADRTYRRLLERWPGNVEALIGLGETAKARGDDPAALAWFQDAAKAVPADLRPRQHIRALRKVQGYYDWKTEIEDALAIADADDAPAASQLGAAQILVEHGLTEAAAPVLARLEPDSARARQLIIVSRQLERAGLVQPPPTGEALPGTAEDQLEAIRGCVEQPVPGSETLLIVFAGTNDRVWITFSLLHRILRDCGASIVYVRDLRRLQYAGGVVGLGDDFASTVEGFQDLATRYGAKRILTLGNCVGSRGALDYGLALRAEGVLGISPKLRRRDDPDPTQKSRIEAIRQKMPPGHTDLHARYLAAATRPKVTLIYGEDYRPDAADIAYMSGIPDLVAAGIPGSGDPDSMKDLMVRELLTPVLRDFLTHGTVSAELRTRIAASVNP